MDLCPRREDALQRDAKIEGEVRHHVVVRLIATSGRECLGSHIGERIQRGGK
jgi:hypothetical protein